MKKKNLFSEFSPVSKADWLARVEKDLKGKSLISLNWQIQEGISLSPFAHSDDMDKEVFPIQNNKVTNSWETGEIIIVTDTKRANTQALKALQNGVNALCFYLRIPLGRKKLRQLLESIQLEWISIHFFSKRSIIRPVFFMETLQYLLEERNLENQKVSGSIHLDFFNLSGELKKEKFVDAIHKRNKCVPKFRLLNIDGFEYYQRGDDVVEELRQLLIRGKKYLSDQEEYREMIGGLLKFSIVLDCNYFLSIAKIRALKILWANILKAYQMMPQAPVIDVHLNPITQGKDSNQNKIMVTSQAMSAVIAGVDRIFIASSDAYENPEGTNFSRRIARNVQHLLQMESYLDRVIDPAAGSYYIEKLTTILVEAVWKQLANK